MSKRSSLWGRIGNAIAWRRQIFEAKRVQFRMKFRTTMRWWFCRKGRPHGLPAPVIVSLTSYPKRYDTLPYTLKCLLTQTVRPDKVVLWIAHADMAALTPELRALEKAGLVIGAVEDLRSYNKIIPSLAAYPDAYICTADDDVYYERHWLEELVADVVPGEPVVTCHRVHEITVDGVGDYRRYREWVMETPRRGESAAFFPTGVGGVLYPPGVLAYSASDYAEIGEVCPRADDVWLYWIGRRNGARYKAIGTAKPILCWDGSQETALFLDNTLQDGNDPVIQEMARRHGYPAVHGV